MQRTLTVIIPVYNDWDPLLQLVPRVHDALKDQPGLRVSLLVVDDGSDTRAPVQLTAGRADLAVLRLKRNLGHQRAISVALAYLAEKVRPDFAAVIDGDGEDDPRDLPRLLERVSALSSPGAAFAERSRRAEGLVFKFFYLAYKILHLAATGCPVKFGNYSVINAGALSALSVAPETWSHYAAAAVKLRLAIVTVPTARLKRLSGSSKMNFFSLVAHGLGAMSVFGDIIGARALGAISALVIVVLALMAAVPAIRLGADLAVPGWATYSLGLLASTLLQLGMLAVVFAFLTLAGRQNSSFLPLRDYRYYIDGPLE